MFWSCGSCTIPETHGDSIFASPALQDPWGLAFGHHQDDNLWELPEISDRILVGHKG